MKLLRELKIYRMEEIDDVSDTDDDYENDDFDLELDDEDADQFDDDSESFDDELEPAASGPDPDEQDMMGSEENEFGDDSFDDEFGDEDEFADDEFGGEDDEFSDDEFGDEDDEFSDDEDDLGGEEQQDQNYQGNIRSIPGAFLVYKREAEDSTFEELWLYNVGKDIKHEMKLRRAILTGTDISPQTGKSKDNKQTAKITSLGNVQFLNVFGIPN